MALELKIDITQDLETGESIRIDDITGNYTPSNTGGYGFPNTSINAVTKTRFLFRSYLTTQQAENVTECIPNVEYQVTGTGSGVVEVDGKEFSLGDVFILEADGTPTIPSGLYVTQTGAYAVLPTFLPTDGNVEFTPAEIGINQLTFPDSAYQTTYEIYTTEYLEGASFPAGTYIVSGTSLDVIEVASTGFQYRVGEVFTVGSTDTFTNVSGTNSVAFQDSTVTEDFPLFYDSWTAYKTVEQEYVNDACCNKECVEQKLFRMNATFEAIVINYQDDLNLDDSGTQGLLDEIIDLSNQQCP